MKNQNGAVANNTTAPIRLNTDLARNAEWLEYLVVHEMITSTRPTHNARSEA